MLKPEKLNMCYSYLLVSAMQTVTSITAEGVEWQWKSFDRAAAIARAVPELERMARFAPKESSGHMNLAVD